MLSGWLGVTSVGGVSIVSNRLSTIAHVVFVLTQNCFNSEEEKLTSKKYSKPSTVFFLVFISFYFSHSLASLFFHLFIRIPPLDKHVSTFL
jgi:hypothetical protein